LIDTYSSIQETQIYTFTNHISSQFSLHTRSILHYTTITIMEPNIGISEIGHQFILSKKEIKSSLFCFSLLSINGLQQGARVEDTQTTLGYMGTFNDIIVILTPQADVANPILSLPKSNTVW